MAVFIEKDAIMNGATVGENEKIYEEWDAKENGERIKHPDADDWKYIKPNRLTCAKDVIRELLYHIKNKKQGNVTDFSHAYTNYKGAFKMIWFSKYAKKTNSAKYNENKSKFDKMTDDDFVMEDKIQ